MHPTLMIKPSNLESIKIITGNNNMEAKILITKEDKTKSISSNISNNNPFKLK